jgi:hypothetical protein
MFDIDNTFSCNEAGGEEHEQVTFVVYDAGENIPGICLDFNTPGFHRVYRVQQF